MYNHVLTRNDDFELLGKVAEYWYKRDERLSPEQFTAYVRELPSLDEIARARRKAIAKWKGTRYLPTQWAIAKKRKISRRRWNSYIAKDETVMEYLETNGLPAADI
jgi:hypothetical protein